MTCVKPCILYASSTASVKCNWIRTSIVATPLTLLATINGCLRTEAGRTTASCTTSTQLAKKDWSKHLLQQLVLVTNVPAVFSGPFVSKRANAKYQQAKGNKPRCSTDNTCHANLVLPNYLKADVNLLEQWQRTFGSMDAMYMYCTAEAGSAITG